MLFFLGYFDQFLKGVTRIFDSISNAPNMIWIVGARYARKLVAMKRGGLQCVRPLIESIETDPVELRCRR